MLTVPIGCGAQADVYCEGGRAIKVYKEGHLLSEARRELELQRLAVQAGLPVPKACYASEIDGRPAVVMEYLEGETLGDELERDMSSAPALLAESVELQLRVHVANAYRFPLLREKLIWKLNQAPLPNDGRRDALLDAASRIPDGDSLCHGDFHVYNLVRTLDGIRIIDWVDSARGPAEVDACRTYLLYQLHAPELSELYMDCYLGRTQATRADCLRWLPVLAGARLSEIVRPGDRGRLLKIVNLA